MLEERDVLAGGGRQHGADLRLRVASLLDDGSAEAAGAIASWRYAR